MGIRAWTLAGAVIALVALPAAARATGENAGTSAAGFLASGPGGASSGMGGASLAFSDDLTGAVGNPAALGGVRSLSVAFAHSGLADESRQEWAAVGGAIGEPWRWSCAGLFVNQGSFDGRDAAGQPTGSFTAGSTALSGSLARQFGATGAAGVTARWVGDRLGDVTGSGVCFDAGIQLRHGMLGFGAGAQNVGGSMRYSGASYPMPSSWGVGASLRHPAGLGLAIDYNLPRAYYQDVRAGVEYRWRGMLALRGGYRRELGSDPETEALDGPSFGLGAGSRGWWLDYSFAPSNLGSSEQRVALSFAMGHATGGVLGATAAPAPATARPK